MVIYLRRTLPCVFSGRTRRLGGPRQRLLRDLAADGVCRADVSPRRRCALTTPFHPYLAAVSFCCTDPSGRPASPLASILPCAARTFLGMREHPATTRPAP